MKNIDLFKDDLRKIFFKYLVPGVLSSIVVSLYIFVDTMFVGIGVGTYGLAALNIVFPMFTLFNSLSLCIGIGGANVLSISNLNSKGKNNIFVNSIIFTLIIGILISIFGVLFTYEIGKILGTTPEVEGLFGEYFKILVGFTWAFLLAGVLGCFIRNDKNPKLVMIATIISNVINVILDYIFIFEFNWGMKGAVIATVISPVVNILILFLHFRNKNSSLRFFGFKFNRNIIYEILGNGFGTFILEFCRGITIFMFNNVLIRLGGNIYVAAYGILLNVSYVVISIFSGIAQSIQPIVSSNYGAGNIKRVNKACIYGILTSGIFGILSYIFIFIFSKNISSLFTKGDLQLVNITSKGMKIYFIACIFMAINIVLIYFFQSVNNSRRSTVISLCSGIVFIILGFIILVPKFNILGVWMVFPFAEFLGFLLSIFSFRKVNLCNEKKLTI